MQEKITPLLEKYSRQKMRPDNSPVIAIDLADAKKISLKTGLSLHEVEEHAMRAGITPSRYVRNQHVLSIKDQLKLHMAHIAVIGLGGLGGGVTELLARVGVGALRLIDGDVFDESNLNRQLLCTVSNIGIAKATVAGKRVTEVNPTILVQTHHAFLNDENGYNLLGNVDIAVDCLDTISARFSLERSCRKHNISMVSAAIAGKSGQAATISPDASTLTNLYGQEGDAPAKGIETGLGTLGYTASHMASIECAEVINLILGIQSPLQVGLLFSDLTDYSVEHIQIR